MSATYSPTHQFAGTQQPAMVSTANDLGEDRVCPGCKQSVVDENGGVVVAFGPSLFHVDCFRCAKCGSLVTAETNILLLSDGSPVCSNCSYNCNICNQPILDEAIMTGDDAYHANCFKCKVCKNRIDELIFAKTSQGIYCMNCHSERVARSRRHAQKKQKDADRSRDRNPPGSHPSNNTLKVSTSSNMPTPIPTPRKSNEIDQLRAKVPARPSALDSASPMPKRGSLRPLESSSRRASGVPKGPLSPIQAPSPSAGNSGSGLNSPTRVLSPTNNLAPPQGQSFSATRSESTSRATSPTLSSFSAHAVKHSQTLPLPATPHNEKRDSLRRRGSDASVTKPLNVLFGNGGAQAPPEVLESPSADLTTFQHTLSPAPPHNLSVNNSRAAKRSSINPGMAMNGYDFSTPAVQAPPSSSSSLSPTSPPVPRPNAGTPRDPSRPPTALHDYSPTVDQLSSRPVSPAMSSTRGHDELGRESPRLPNISTPPDGVPPRPQGLRQNSHDSIMNSQINGQLSPLADPGLRNQRSFDERSRIRSSLSAEDDRRSSAIVNGEGGRPRSRSVSGTPENENPPPVSPSASSFRSRSRSSNPPALPPKHDRVNSPLPDAPSSVDEDLSDSDELVQDPGNDNDNDSSEESSPVEHTRRMTIISSALLPPIRISIVGSDLGDMLDFSGDASLQALRHSLPNGMTDDLPPKHPPQPPSIPLDLGDLSNSPTTPTAAPQEIAIPPRSPGVVSPPLSAGRPPAHVIPHARTSSLSSLSSGSILAAQNATRSSLDSQRRAPLNASMSAHPGATLSPQKTPPKQENNSKGEIALRVLKEALSDAQIRGAPHIKLDKELLEAVVLTMDQRLEQYSQMKGTLDGMKRASAQFIEGMSVAQEEYDKEVAARRHAESEVSRLKVQLTGQQARLSAIQMDERRRELTEKLERDRTSHMDDLEQRLSALKIQRDISLAEIDELSASKGNIVTSPEDDQGGAKLGRTLATRLDNLKQQYQTELAPLGKQRESLLREISELKQTRDSLLEESSVLNARSEELMQLIAQDVRRLESLGYDPSLNQSHDQFHSMKSSNSFDHARSAMSSSQTTSTLNSSGAPSFDGDTMRSMRPQRLFDGEIPAPPAKNAPMFKWPGKGRNAGYSSEMQRPKGQYEHAFQQISVLRFARCDHCAEKMWGTQLRCNNCNMSVHTRCGNAVHGPCMAQNNNLDFGPLPPSMFGRDLIMQVHDDAAGTDRSVPLIVEKCIEAVEAIAMEYEGIYRKNGGAGQCKMITQLFERGQYDAFDLRNSDQFNDVASVTSVLKNYFRSLPDPLFTFSMHETFISSANIRDPIAKNAAFSDTVNQLPAEHYSTLRFLMMHLYRVSQQSDVNLMTARNLGVVFGPTLMRSRDPNAEFSDMAGKALTVEWLVENAPQIFPA